MRTTKWVVGFLALALGTDPVLGAVKPSKAKHGRWNVLFIMADDLCNCLGCYGDPQVKTPHLDKLAARGVRFDHAYCQFPLCNPSRASMWTGRRPDETGVRDNQFNFRTKIPDTVTLPELFRTGGYFVARVGKMYHYGVPNQIGTSGMDDAPSWMKVVNPRGRDREEHDKIHSIHGGQAFGGTLSWLADDGVDAEHTDGKGASAAIQLLERHKDHPFFLAVGFYRPHTPYVAPKSYFDLYPLDSIRLFENPANDRADIPKPALFVNPPNYGIGVERQKQAKQAYQAAVTFMDAQVGRVLESLDQLGLADLTIVVFTSDHGYHLGEHGLWQKRSLFEESARVPLLVAMPGKAAGRGCARIVELVDLYPTLAELCGLQAPEYVDGKSLAGLLDDPEAPGKDFAVTETRGELGRGKWVSGRSLRVPRWRYTEWGGGKAGAELYDHDADPHEFTNLADDPAHAKTRAELRERLAEIGLAPDEQSDAAASLSGGVKR